MSVIQTGQGRSQTFSLGFFPSFHFPSTSSFPFLSPPFPFLLSPNPVRGLMERCELPAGSAAAPRLQTHFGDILRPENVSDGNFCSFKIVVIGVNPC